MMQQSDNFMQLLHATTPYNHFMQPKSTLPLFETILDNKYNSGQQLYATTLYATIQCKQIVKQM